MNVLIAGASGAVGEGLVVELLHHQHNVTAIVRTEEKKVQLNEHVLQSGIGEPGNFKSIVGDYSNEMEVAQLSQVLSDRHWHIAIASLGGWYHGDLLHKVSLTDWNDILQNSLTSHFLFAKAILPILQKQDEGVYIMINGGAAEYPVLHSGAISIVAAAQKMMANVLSNELKGDNVRVYGVGAFDLVKTKERHNQGNLWLGPAEIARYILKLVEQKSENYSYWHALRQPSDLQ